MAQILWIDLRAGISGDRIAAALIGLGVPERGMTQVIKSVGEEFGLLDAHIHLEFLPDENLANQLHIVSLERKEPLLLDKAPAILKKTLTRAGVEGAYADFAQQVLNTAPAFGALRLSLVDIPVRER